MSTKRDYVREILDKRRRLFRRADPEEQFCRRVHPVVAGFRFIKRLGTGAPLRKELLKYGAIGYVACLEGYLRLAVRDLIDAGAPYSDNAAGLDEIKIGINTVVSITSKKITLGEYIAHLIPLNNLSDINRCMSTVLGCDFIAELKKFDVSYRPDGKKVTLEDLDQNIFGVLEELFRLRNIYAHELATSEVVRPRKIEKCISAAASFQDATSRFLATRMARTNHQQPTPA